MPVVSQHMRKLFRKRTLAEPIAITHRVAAPARYPSARESHGPLAFTNQRQHKGCSISNLSMRAMRGRVQEEMRSLLYTKDTQLTKLQLENEKVASDMCAIEEELTTAQARADAATLRSEAQWEVRGVRSVGQRSTSMLSTFCKHRST